MKKHGLGILVGVFLVSCGTSVPTPLFKLLPGEGQPKPIVHREATPATPVPPEPEAPPAPVTMEDFVGTFETRNAEGEILSARGATEDAHWAMVSLARDVFGGYNLSIAISATMFPSYSGVIWNANSLKDGLNGEILTEGYDREKRSSAPLKIGQVTKDSLVIDRMFETFDWTKEKRAGRVVIRKQTDGSLRVELSFKRDSAWAIIRP